jgi:hypothetical protein
MKPLAKSLLAAFMGTGIFFCFLMMGVIPIMALLARVNGNIAKLSVVVDPQHVLRVYGLPTAAAMFVFLFFMSLGRFRRDEQHQVSAAARR